MAHGLARSQGPFAVTPDSVLSAYLDSVLAALEKLLPAVETYVISGGGPPQPDQRHRLLELSRRLTAAANFDGRGGPGGASATPPDTATWGRVPSLPTLGLAQHNRSGSTPPMHRTGEWHVPRQASVGYWRPRPAGATNAASDGYAQRNALRGTPRRHAASAATLPRTVGGGDADEGTALAEGLIAERLMQDLPPVDSDEGWALNFIEANIMAHERRMPHRLRRCMTEGPGADQSRPTSRIRPGEEWVPQAREADVTDGCDTHNMGPADDGVSTTDAEPTEDPCSPITGRDEILRLTLGGGGLAEKVGKMEAVEEGPSATRPPTAVAVAPVEPTAAGASSPGAREEMPPSPKDSVTSSADRRSAEATSSNGSKAAEAGQKPPKRLQGNRAPPPLPALPSRLPPPLPPLAQGKRPGTGQAADGARKNP